MNLIKFTRQFPLNTAIFNFCSFPILSPFYANRRPLLWWHPTSSSWPTSADPWWPTGTKTRTCRTICRWPLYPAYSRRNRLLVLRCLFTDKLSADKLLADHRHLLVVQIIARKSKDQSEIDLLKSSVLFNKLSYTEKNGLFYVDYSILLLFYPNLKREKSRHHREKWDYENCFLKQVFWWKNFIKDRGWQYQKSLQGCSDSLWESLLNSWIALRSRFEFDFF